MTYKIIGKSDELPEKGDFYTHFKDPKKLYIVEGTALMLVEPNIMGVVYTDLGTNKTFVRPLNEFVDLLELESGELVSRFTRV